MNGYKTPPLIKTDKTPEQILGILWEPFSMWIKHRNSSKNEVKLKEADAARMSKCILDLERHGYVVGDHRTGLQVDANGNVLFSVIMRNQTDQMFAGPEFDYLKTLSTADHRKIAQGHLRMVKEMDK